MELIETDDKKQGNLCALASGQLMITEKELEAWMRWEQSALQLSISEFSFLSDTWGAGERVTSMKAPVWSAPPHRLWIQFNIFWRLNSVTTALWPCPRVQNHLFVLRFSLYHIKNPNGSFVNAPTGCSWGLKMALKFRTVYNIELSNRQFLTEENGAENYADLVQVTASLWKKKNTE